MAAALMAMTPTQAVASTRKTGLFTAGPSTRRRLGQRHDVTEQHGVITLHRRLLVCAVLAVPVVVLAMVPALRFRSWQWLSLRLAAPVVVWGAWPFHRAAVINTRNRAATMDTLISLGVLAAFGWSLGRCSSAARVSPASV